MTGTTHTISTRPSLRALALGAVATVVGLGLVLVGTLAAWPWSQASGWVLVAVGLVLFAAAWLTARRGAVAVSVDDSGYTVDGPDGTHRGDWAEVSRVTRAADRIILYRSDGSTTELVAPRSSRADLDALGAEIAQALDANRGYGR